jgi:fatty aldehyde-generating acyl-ACP reductase
MGTFRLIYKAFEDLYLGLITNKKKEEEDYSFGFLIHPRTVEDTYRQYPFFRFIPERLILFITKIYWPLTISRITGLKSQKTGREIKGYIFAIPLTAHQIFENRDLALKKIFWACRLAKNRGVNLIGLGGLISSVTRGGLDVIENKLDIDITTGHAYTAHNVTSYLFEFCERFDLDKNVPISIVGATGSVGSTSAKILAKAGFDNLFLIDIERKNPFFDSLVGELKAINPNIKIETNHKISEIKKTTFIIAATNAPEALIKSDDLSSGSIIIDDAQPSDVHEEVFDREDVLVLGAGAVYTPGISSGYNFELKGEHDNYCCLAEVLILSSMEHDGHFVVHRADFDSIDRIKEMAKGMGFKTAIPQNFKEIISESKIIKVGEIIKEKLQNEL